MPLIDPKEAFRGSLLVASPHMDDEVLACGGLLARLAEPTSTHIVYATDGMRSPAPVQPWRQSISPDLGALRMEESRRAVALFGVPEQNLSFLQLPEARLQQHREKLAELLIREIDECDPDHVLVPFRYDRHPDHLAVNEVVCRARRSGRIRAQISEYFVYHRWRLLPRGDIRRYIRPEYLLELPIADVAERKRSSLDCFETQTTKFYDWQTRPILTPELLDDECARPEFFLRCDPEVRGASVFSHAAAWIRVAHRLEPKLQKWKYLVKANLMNVFGHGGGPRDQRDGR